MTLNIIQSVLFFLYRLEYRKTEKAFWNSGEVKHLERDTHYNDGTILYSDHWKLYTTNGSHRTALLDHTFSGINSFRQLNSTHIIVTETYKHCLRVVNRVGPPNIVTLAGVCGTYGNSDGTPGLFHEPWGVEIDNRDRDKILVLENLNNALRSVDIVFGEVITVCTAGFYRPKNMAWYNDHLLVTNDHFISRVVWWRNSSVINTRIIGTPPESFQWGSQDGHFNVSRFFHPREIQHFLGDLFLVADSKNHKLRLLDMRRQLVLPVCISNDPNTPCIPEQSTRIFIISAFLQSRGNLFVSSSPSWVLKLTSKYVCIVCLLLV